MILPLLEDANSIQMALQQVMRLVLHHDVDYKTAGLLLYALQTASSNLRQTKFEALRHDVILDPRDAADSSLGEKIWDDEDFEEDEDDDPNPSASKKKQNAPPRLSAQNTSSAKPMQSAAKSSTRNTPTSSPATSNCSLLNPHKKTSRPSRPAIRLPPPRPPQFRKNPPCPHRKNSIGTFTT